jgi:transposase
VDPQLLLPQDAGLVVEHVQLRDEIVHVTVRCEASGANCRDCGAWSEAFHSTYERSLSDLPIAGGQAVIDLRVRRFRCYQLGCPRKTFVEQACILAQRYAHRTRRLRTLLEEIGLALGGRPGSRHTKRVAIPTSRSTLLRMVRALPERPMATPTVLGVDEFALRRGRHYGTILVDAEAHTIVELLENPSADALVEWLSNHPGAKVICRDRDGVYASAARRGEPEALQVADRWHLVHNLVTTSAPTTSTLTGLNNTACPLVVYASSPSLPTATQDSLRGCWLALPDGTGYPLGSSAKFQSSLHLILLAQALPVAPLNSIQNPRSERWRP